MYFALWQASAVDIDHGTNAELRYTIVNNDDAGPFLINSTSGEIFTVGKLDWETQEFYSIQVRSVYSTQDNNNWKNEHTPTL